MSAAVVYRLFADLDGVTVELFGHISGMDRAEFSARFPRAKGRRFDSRRMQVAADAAGRVLPVTRAIEFKKVKRLKQCDARCMYALGPNCECKCGGKNHGRGDGGAQTGFFEDNWSPMQTGFSEDSNARVEELASDFALEFMGGALDLGGDQLELGGIGGGEAPARPRDSRQTNLF
jgi:hypothetical protein